MAERIRISLSGQLGVEVGDAVADGAALGPLGGLALAFLVTERHRPVDPRRAGRGPLGRGAARRRGSRRSAAWSPGSAGGWRRPVVAGGRHHRRRGLLPAPPAGGRGGRRRGGGGRPRRGQAWPWRDGDWATGAGAGRRRRRRRRPAVPARPGRAVGRAAPGRARRAPRPAPWRSLSDAASRRRRPRRRPRRRRGGGRRPAPAGVGAPAADGRPRRRRQPGRGAAGLRALPGGPGRGAGRVAVGRVPRPPTWPCWPARRRPAPPSTNLRPELSSFVGRDEARRRGREAARRPPGCSPWSARAAWARPGWPPGSAAELRRQLPRRRVAGGAGRPRRRRAARPARAVRARRSPRRPARRRPGVAAHPPGRPRAAARPRQLRAPVGAVRRPGPRPAARRARAGGPGHQPGAARRARRDALAGAAAVGARPPMRPALWDSDAVRLFVERASAVDPDFGLSTGTGAGRRRDLPAARRAAAGHRAGCGPGPDRSRSPRSPPASATASGCSWAATPRLPTATTPCGPRSTGATRRCRPPSRRSSARSRCSPAASASTRGRGCARRDRDDVDVLDGLAALVDKSLVLADRSGPTTRYRLLETLRQYGAERLAAAGEEPAVRDRHLAWVRALAEEADAAARGRRAAVVAATALDAEEDNVRAALDWAVAHPAGDDGLRVAGALWRYWQVAGPVRRGRALAADACSTSPPTLRRRSGPRR